MLELPCIKTPNIKKTENKVVYINYLIPVYAIIKSINNMKLEEIRIYAI